MPPDTIRAAFEVEHSTSIYSGIVRLLDLSLGAAGQSVKGLFLVAPDDRHREAMARFGAGMKAVEAIARRLM